MQNAAANTMAVPPASASGKLSVLFSGMLAKGVTAEVRIIGDGLLQGAVTNSGLIAASSGTLDITGVVAGLGTLRLDMASTLALDGQPGASLSVIFNSTAETLIIGAPSIDITGLGGGNFAFVTSVSEGDRVELGNSVVISRVSLVANGGTTNADIGVTRGTSAITS